MTVSLLRLAPLCFLVAAASASAQPAPEAQPLPGRLVAGVSEAAPFAVKQPDGTWDGVAVHLWREMGREAGFEAVVRELPKDSLLAALETGAVDVLLTLPARIEGEDRADFTHAYVTAALGVAQKKQTPSIGDVLGRFFSPTFFKIAAGLALLLLGVGVLVWLLERNENADDYPEAAKPGIWNGFWWAGVTMTTIGYGDISPKTVPGRSLALFWMLFSMALTAALTTALVAALGLGGGGSGGNLSFPSDLRDKRVGVVEGAGAAGLLGEERIRTRTFPSVEAGLRAVANDSLDAFVGTAPLLRHTLDETEADGLEVTTTDSEPERMALAVAAESPHREGLSRLVLERTRGPAWRALLERWGVNDGS